MDFLLNANGRAFHNSDTTAYRLDSPFEVQAANEVKSDRVNQAAFCAVLVNSLERAFALELRSVTNKDFVAGVDESNKGGDGIGAHQPRHQ